MTERTISPSVGRCRKSGFGLLRIVIGTTLAIAFTLQSLAFAAQDEVPAEMMSLWCEFRDAVGKRDIEKVATLSMFPIAANDFGGQIKSAAILKKRYRQIFTPSVEACFSSEQPKAVSGYPGYLVDCDGYLAFGFRKFGGEYRFSYIDNANAE